jgi:CBS domain containing-hemolysin-like protein
VIFDFLKRHFFPSKDNLKESIEGLLQEGEEQEESISNAGKRLLNNVLQASHQTADDVKVPRVEIAAIAVGMPYDEVIQKYKDTGFSRLIVYHDTLDHVIGSLHVRDLLSADTKKEIPYAKLCREVLFIPPSIPLLDLLLQMQATNIPIACVVDEYGGIDGIVTGWTVIRELIGDTEGFDNFDQRNAQVTTLSDGSLILNARMDIDDFEEMYGPLLTAEERQEENIDTIGGLVATLAGRVPSRREVISHDSGVQFEILEADPRRVLRVRIHPAVDKPFERREEGSSHAKN